MAIEGRIVSHYYVSYILVNCNFTDFISLFRHRHFQVLCLGKGEKSWKEREGTGGEPLDKPLRPLFCPLVYYC